MLYKITAVGDKEDVDLILESTFFLTPPRSQKPGYNFTVLFIVAVFPRVQTLLCNKTTHTLTLVHTFCQDVEKRDIQSKRKTADKLEVEGSGVGRGVHTGLLVLQNGAHSNKQCELEGH